MSVAGLGTTAMTTAIGIHRDDELVAGGELRHVFVDREGGGRTPIPTQVRTALTPYVREAPQLSG